MTGLKNAFMLSDDVSAVRKCAENGVSSITVATHTPSLFDGEESVTVYNLVEKPSDIMGKRLCLTSLSDDKTVDAVTERVLGNGAELAVFASYSLDEIGAIEARFHLTPVQLLHKLGLLEKATIVGGVYLERDDVELMRTSKARLVLCPTCSLGYGYGIPQLRALIGRIEIAVGSGDNAFNKSGNMIEELKALYLSVCADMRTREAVSYNELFSLVTDARHGDYKKLLFG